MERLSRGIYLLPNLFTTLAIFSGFYAVVAGMKGLYNDAAMAIFIAMVADTLDGRVARLTNTTSEFGAQYDSLSDMVAFGIAPALVVYSWSLHALGKIGWLLAFFYTAATALRLARFNVRLEDEDTDPRYFSGLPCPAAAAVATSVMWLQHRLAWHTEISTIILGVITAGVAALMVSNLPYPSFKKLDLKGKVPFLAILCVVLVYVAISIDPPTVLFCVFGAYTLSGLVLSARRQLFQRSHRQK